MVNCCFCGELFSFPKTQRLPCNLGAPNFVRNTKIHSEFWCAQKLGFWHLSGKNFGNKEKDILW